MPLRDFLIAPREAGGLGEAAGARGGGAHGEAAATRSEAASRDAAAVRDEDASPAGARRFGFSLRPRERAGAAALPASLGVLAYARDVPAVAVAVGVFVARRDSAVVVCVHAPGQEALAPTLRLPARAGAARLAASLRARGLAADARGRVAIVDLAREEDVAGAAARALAAAGALPSVFAVAARDPDLDVLLAAQDAILVALPPSADPTLAELAVSSAARLAPRAGSIALSLDPASRALALAGVRAPAALRAAVGGVLA
jgi:hypothetical protein